MLGRLSPDNIARVVFGVVCLGFAVGFFVFPTYPNYDSYYSLLWGREVIHLDTPVFEGFRIPTEHPLSIAVGAVLALFGQVGDRIFIALIFASFLWLIWAVYRLGRIAFTPLVGGLAALLLLTRFDFAFLAARRGDAATPKASPASASSSTGSLTSAAKNDGSVDGSSDRGCERPRSSADPLV